MTKKIVVTGIGATSPLGGTAESSWDALLAGESGVHTLEHEWVEQYDLPVTFAAEAKVRPADVLERVESKRLDPSAQFALISAREAWADAGTPDVDPLRVGVATRRHRRSERFWTWDTLREGPASRSADDDPHAHADAPRPRSMPSRRAFARTMSRPARQAPGHRQRVCTSSRAADIVRRRNRRSCIATSPRSRRCRRSRSATTPVDASRPYDST